MRLLSPQDWKRLPPQVKARFSKQTHSGSRAVYRGKIISTEMNIWGQALAQIMRVWGSPLPLERGNSGAAARVIVTHEERSGGQVWTRQYAQSKSGPQIIKSAKRFAGPTGLEEHIGGGIGMTLDLSVDNKALLFRSNLYFCSLGRLRFYLPEWASPGNLTVGHIDQGGGYFEFSLRLEHKIFGALFHQRIRFHDERFL